MGFIGQWISGELSGSSDAAEDAAQIEADASMAAVEEQRRQYNQTREDMQPWLQAGQNALNQLQNPSENFKTSEGYQFRLSEGQRDLSNSYAAKGGALSGNALRALTQYNQNVASNEYNNWWNQQAGLAGVGQNSANTLASTGQSSANSIGNYLQNAGSARASGVTGQAAYYQNLYNQGSQNAMNWLGYMYGGY